MTVPPALTDVLDRIARAAKACGRAPRDVTLVAVSKMQPWERIEPVLAAGQAVFGENRVQEAMERWTPYRERIELRLIGPLQSNKAKEAVAFFDVIESLDREKLARALAGEVQRQGRSPRLYVRSTPGRSRRRPGSRPPTPTPSSPPARRPMTWRSRG